MKSTLQTVLAAIVIVAVSAASQHLALLKTAEEYLARNRNTLLAFTIPIAALGFIVFIVQLMLMLYEKGQPMSHSEVEEQFRLAQNTRMLPYTARFSKYWVFGTAEGRQFSEERNAIGAMCARISSLGTGWPAARTGRLRRGSPTTAATARNA